MKVVKARDLPFKFKELEVVYMLSKEFLAEYYKSLDEDDEDSQRFDEIENDSSLSEVDKRRKTRELLHEIACRTPSPQVFDGETEVWEGLKEFFQFEDEVNSYEENIKMNRSEELENLIKEYASSYYTGVAEVSDEYFDGLVEELRELNPTSELFNKPGWGYEPKEKVPHLYNLTIGSLSKIHDASEIPESLGERFYVSPKLDGLSVVSYYLNGKRVKSVTRGNGKVGQNVTTKMRVISPLTEVLPEGFTGAVRGEVIIERSAWDSYVEVYGLEDDPSANPRNCAAGILNRNSIDSDIRFLSYVPYKVIAEDWGRHVETVSGNDNFLLKYGSAPRVLVERSWNVNTVLKRLYDSWCKTYPCDGVVLTAYNVARDHEVNVFNEVAFKFPTESKEVVVTDVDWNATRTGRMQPRIWFDPIVLSGATVRKCTGFNAAFIRDNKINKGTVIEVTRSNEVIPTIKRVVSNTATEGLLPKECPNCGNSDLVWSGDDLICENENETQLAYRFITTVAPVDGCGWSLYTEYLELFEIRSFEDLVRFLIDLRTDPEGVSSANSEVDRKYAEATANKLKTITSKLVGFIDPVAFLVGCNLKGVSWNSASALFKTYPNFIMDVLDKSVNWDLVSSTPGFGYKTVATLKKFEDRIRRLAEFCSVLYPEDCKESVKFKVAITGSLSMKRSDFEKLLKDKGIEVGSNFKEIKYLITNNPDSGSSKMKKAKENNVEVISESLFTDKYLKE